jgi:hypothetical protein
MIHVGEEIIADSNQRFRVVDVVAFEEEDESPFVGLSRRRLESASFHASKYVLIRSSTRRLYDPRTCDGNLGRSIWERPRLHPLAR